MRVFKKGLVIALVLALAVTVMQPALQRVSAVEYILEPSSISGGDYTASDRMAVLLDQIFEGDIDIYSEKEWINEVSMPLGTYMSNDTLYHVRSQTTGNPVSGWQCYIYANAVYNKLFQEWVGHAESFLQSEVVIPGGSDTISYELMRDSGVRCGAYFRTTGNSDGSYSGSVGHSMIILAYDSEMITYLEGNGDGNGLVRVAIRPWDDFNLRQLSGRGRYIAHVVQPTDEFYQAQFPGCPHETYEDYGVCTSCGNAYDWQATREPWAKGIYRLTEKVIPRADAPYSEAAAAGIVLTRNQTIQTTGRYRNAYDQVWYSAEDENGNTFYVNGASLKFVEHLPLEVTCTGFSPENGAVLEQKSYPVKGRVTSNFPLKTVKGYLDGELFATWTASNETTVTLELRQTEINSKLSFSKLEGGRHTVMLEAQSFVYGEPVIIHESEFFTVSPEPCNHSHSGSVTRDATCTEDGLLTYTCSKCDDTYTRIIMAHGHNYQDHICSYCGEKRPLSNLSGSLRSTGVPEDPILVALSGASGEVYSVTAQSGSYTIADIMPGTYTITVTKNGCVTLTAELTLESGDTILDIKLTVSGDVTGEGTLNIGDVGKIYSHIRKRQIIQDAYGLLCADCNGDGTVNIGDVVKLYGSLTK